MDTDITPGVRTAFVGMASGLLAGLICAVIARLLMRVVAVALFGHGGFSVGGTANIFMFAALIGPLFGLAYYRLREWLPGPSLLKGLLFAVILMVIFQFPVLYLVPDFRREIMAAGRLGLGVFGLINLSFCLTLALITPRIEAWRGHGRFYQRAMLPLTMILGLLALGGLLVLVVELGGRAIGVVE